MKKRLLISNLLLLGIVATGISTIQLAKASVQHATATSTEIDITPNKANTGNASTKYVTSAVTYTVESVSYVVNQWNPNNLQIKVNQGNKNSLNASNFSLYNSTETKENITKIEVTFSSGTINAAYFQVSTSATSAITTTQNYDVSNSTSYLNSTLTWTYKYDSGIKFFRFGCAQNGGNVYIKSFKITTQSEAQKLNAPANLSFDNSTKTLTWDAVENADSYELTVMDETTMEENVYTSTTNSYDFSSFADDTYLVSIVAKDSTGSCSDSVASNTTFTIETSGPKLTSITYEGTPKTQYIGKEFDYEGLTFTPHYDSDNSNPEEILGSDINWPELTEGMTSITGTYRGISVTIDPIVVKEDIVESIEIGGDMAIKNYVTVQESFDSTGLTVTGTYSSGETKDVTAESTFTFEKTPSEVGATTGTSITVNVEYNGLTSSKTINDIVISKATVDVITADKLAATSTTYTSFSDLKINDAVYAGSTSKNKGAIQLRSKNSDSGIYSTKTGGLVTKVSIEWQNGSNTLDVYGKNEPYTAVGDLYSSSSQGTKIGSITSGSTTELSINGNYHFIGLRSNYGALYIKSITITYVADTASTLAEYIMSENTEGQCETKFPVANDIYQMLTDEEKAKFVSSSSDETIVNAVARYEAWAISLNVTNPYEAYTTANGTLINSKENKNVIIYASVFGIASIVTVLAFCLRRKKRA